jgi:hypothetical protein
MPQCAHCGKHLVRAHRTPFQRLVFEDVFQCTKCGYRLERWRPIARVQVTFIFSRYSHCVQCGTSKVHRLTKRDRVDSISTNVLSLLFGFSGAPLNKCTACRLQYRDWRSARGDARSAASSQSVSSEP